ncbi:prephenate dehydratase [Anaerocolumna xylanovorans]|uniref:Bifunctional chorismate mutase/prephenate dehydratase n=1 Tax=Anaerocolumna xylanovorans DSM 12503 TaxID=1121345 RepID=A0A1M7YJ33_9FIRM|nr:prephenate dehydratase [Anaerocolumna xylanovorans]SHO52609.1 chorismate mutase [Anaerocolumna xylanovorans DSM 12503]
MIDLQNSRDEIDKVDKEIVRLFEYRMKLTKDVAEYKIQTGKKVYDREREQAKLTALKELAGNDFNRHGVEELFTQIMSMSRKMQYSLVSGDNTDIPFEERDALSVDSSTKVVWFGAKGSYTEQAFKEYFGEDVSAFNVSTFREVMEKVKNGSADYGVLPIENTSTGGITDIYDLLVEYDNSIVGEHILKVDHVLLGLPQAELKDITRVYSHTQGILQCQKFLDTNPQIKPVECKSTSDGARKVYTDGDITQAAIAGKQSAEIYGLKILKENVNHECNNSTRFIIIGKEKKYRKDAKKISICFELPHESGSLYNMLSHFIYNNLNMTKIESRPLEGRTFEYRFFVDFEGNLKDAGVRNALFGIKEEAITLKILGNY